jgi:hypothetical protein
METALLLAVPVDPKQKSLLAASAATRQLGLVKREVTCLADPTVVSA